MKQKRIWRDNMSNVQELKINGSSLYIEELDQLDANAFRQKDHAIVWDEEKIKESIKPAISICEAFKNLSNETLPDEMELSMKFKLCLKGETPVLKIVSAEASAEISIKYVWKNK